MPPYITWIQYMRMGAPPVASDSPERLPESHPPPGRFRPIPIRIPSRAKAPQHDFGSLPWRQLHHHSWLWAQRRENCAREASGEAIALWPRFSAIEWNEARRGSAAARAARHALPDSRLRPA